MLGGSLEGYQQGDEEPPCPEKRTANVVVGAKPQRQRMRIPLRNQGFFITLLGPKGNDISGQHVVHIGAAIGLWLG
jgi:hypothetical protein